MAQANSPLIFDERQSAGQWGTVLGSLVGLALGAAGFLAAAGAAGVVGETTTYWYLSRSAGMIAYLLLWGSVVWGLLLSSKLGRPRFAPAVLLDAHQFISNAAIGFAAFHGLVLMGDRYFSFPLQAVLLPFAGSYQPLWVAAGQIGFWLSVALSLSFVFRRRLGPKTWRTLHYASFLAFWGVLLHSVIIGTDTKLPGVQLLYVLTGGAVLGLTGYRIVTARRHAGPAPQPVA